MTGLVPWAGQVFREGESDGGGLADALVAEHAAVFAYGPVGAWLAEDDAETARDAEEAHRARRDLLLLTLAERDVPAPTPEPGYELPFPVTDEDSARELALLVEERVAGVWRAALPQLAPADRELAVTALIDAAVRATGWRQSAGVTPAVVPFPGAP
ncbi:ferritin-like domain-containing protein [Natronosporangium hydrolyticum]|uniref:Ferritin-like domain-containing protein n=1 Tax=Natronosporangium hydrolyticum TaxID=2811111 RepID=A0A895YDM3_9ACTN|nr:ferritin-like domain-containing protein [Natronosporangium hydrolyticum]QSB13489.1 ferritin-like domain-containing protein [Natronosporangium hydrolyticum]